MASQWISRVERYLWPEGSRRDVWMIVDGARDPRILPLLRAFGLKYYVPSHLDRVDVRRTVPSYPRLGDPGSPPTR